MTRLPIVIAALCLLLAAVPSRADESEWIELVVTPRRVPERVLDVELFPNDAERIVGNAAPILLRLTWEQQPTLLPMLDKAREYLDEPFGDFSPTKLRADVPLVRYSELKRAAYRTTAEWEYPLRETRALHSVLLPDVQQLRTFLRMLSAHARADLKEGKLDEAIEKLRVGFGITAHLGRTPFLVVKLVQNAMQVDLLDRVEELERLESAPNLYWGLTGLPRPLVVLRPVADWEQFALVNVPELADLDAPRTRKEWRAIAERLVKLQRDLASGNWQEVVEQHGGEKTMLADFLKRARERLPVVTPTVANRVAEMSDEEVGVRYFAARVLVEGDRAASILLLPPAEGLPLLADLQARRANWRDDEPEVEAIVGDFSAAPAAIWATERRVAALRIVEALRDHAARHDGELPASLDDIADLPIPVDPFTNRPFAYSVEAGVATLVGEPATIAGKEQFGVRYRIRVR